VSKAFVFLNCDLNPEKDIVDEIKNISGITQATKISGVYDIAAELSADSEEGIANIVRRFRSIASIRSCFTMIVAEKNKVVKENL
jgi:hypothetical protein